MKFAYQLVCFLLISFNSLATTPVWKVDNNGHIIYIAGTIHLLRASDYPLPESFMRAYQNSSLIVFETDIKALKSERAQQLMLRSIMMPVGQNALQILSTEAQHKLQHYFNEHKINPAEYHSFKPSFIALSLSIRELHKHNINQQGVDAFYNLKAITDDKTTMGLETIEQQIKFVSEMATGYENEFIIQTLEDIKRIDDLFDDMLSSWRTGDLEAIERLFITPTKEKFPDMHEQILISRNLAWLPQIKHFTTTPEVEMIMVGIAHLAGKNGVLNLLLQQGYTVTQLK